MQRINATILGLLVCVSMTFLTGCPKQKPEQTARDVIASATGAIEQAQGEYKDSCVAKPGQQECILINQAVYAQNASITGLEIYCSWPKGVVLPSPNTICSPVKSALPALEASVTRLDQLIGQIRAIIQAKAPVTPTPTPRSGVPHGRPPFDVPISPAQGTIPPQAISLAILGLKLLFDNLLKGKGKDVADESLGAVQGALDEFRKHQGQEVTLAELEGLRLHTMWPDEGHPAGSTGEDSPTGGTPTSTS